VLGDNHLRHIRTPKRAKKVVCFLYPQVATSIKVKTCLEKLCWGKEIATSQAYLFREKANFTLGTFKINVPNVPSASKGASGEEKGLEIEISKGH